MTKPENTDTPAPLLLFLKNNDLKAEVFRFTLTEDMLTKLYPDIQHSEDLIKATNDHMLGKEVEVFLVTKDEENTSEKSVLEEVVDLVGKKTKPEDNEEGTLRRHLSGKTESFVDKSGKVGWYAKNGFHRPLTPKELMEHLQIFNLLKEAEKLVEESN